jgi:hypothetical protein
MPVCKRPTAVVIGLGLALLIPTLAAAQESNDWAQGMFDSLSHDFGVVARGTEVRHRFKITNSSFEEVHIANVAASCGCTTAKGNTGCLKRNSTTFVEVAVDTNRFQRQKESTVTVAFDRPRKAIVSLEVKAYIRPDIVVTPNSINFGSFGHGTRQERKVSIAYTGRPDWKIDKVMTSDERVQVHAVETHREGGQVKYELVVALKANLPIGMLRREVVVISNEENGPRFPIAVKASVEADITVTPSIVQLGTVAPGAEITKAIVVRGPKAFAIKRIDGQSCSAAIKPQAFKESTACVHAFPLTFIAPRECGEFSHRFVLSISSEAAVEFTVRGIVDRPQRTALSH